MTEATVAHVTAMIKRAGDAHAAHDHHARQGVILVHRDTLAELAAKAQQPKGRG